MNDETLRAYLDSLTYTPRAAEELARMRKAGDILGLWLHVTPLVVNVAKRLQRAEQTPSAELLDLIQEGSIAAGQAVKSWDPDKGALSTWVVARARGAMLDYARSPKARSGGVVGTQEELRAATIPAGRNAEIESEEESEDAEIVRAAMRSLSPRSRQLVRDYWYTGLTLKEIAERDGVSTTTIHKLLKRAQDNMREFLDAEG